MSRELRVGLVTALVAIIATGAALWSSSPRQPAVPDAIELRVTDTAKASAGGSSRTPRTRAAEDDADARDQDRPSQARQADQPENGDRRARGNGAVAPPRSSDDGSASTRRSSDDDRGTATRRSSDDGDDDDDDDNGDNDRGDGDDD